jgi:transposase InsO family protein
VPFVSEDKVPLPKSRALLQQIVATRPGEIVHADLLELTKTAGGNKYVLALMDAFTKFVNVYPVPNQRADTIADIIFHNYMPEHGVIEQLHTDQGGSFEAKLTKEVCEILQIRKTRTTGYHPQSNGLIERFNRTLINMLAKHHGEHPEDWDKQLSLTAMAYNSTEHTSTGYTPFFLTHGREMRLPVDLMIPVDPPDGRHHSTTSFARTTKNALSDAFQIANNFLDGARKRQKQGYDKWAKEHPYSVGDRVWLFDPTARRIRANKRVLPWVGPYVIRKAFDKDGEKGVTYRIQLEKGRRWIVVHHNRLKPCIIPRKDAEQQVLSKNNHEGRDRPLVNCREQTEGGIQVTVNIEGVAENEDGQANTSGESAGQASTSGESDGQASTSEESEEQDSSSAESENIEHIIHTEQRTRSGRLINPPHRFQDYEV